MRTVNRTSPIWALIAVLCLLGASPALHAAKGDLKRISRVKDPLEVATLLNMWLNQQMNFNLEKDDHLQLVGLLTKGGNQHFCTQVAALYDRMLPLADHLVLSRPGQYAAANMLATHAVMLHCWERKAKQLPETLEEGKKVTWQSMPGISDTKHLSELLITLLESRDEETRTAAAVAAAYYVPDSSELEAAMAKVPAETGPILGAKLLYEARRTYSIDRKLAELAFTVEKDQPKPISKMSPLICGNSVITPAAAMAAEALSIMEQSLDDPLLEMLQTELNENEDIRVQIEAARALGRIRNPGSAPHLLARLNNECAWPVFLEACLALTQCRNKEVIPGLFELLKGSSGRMRQHLLYALSAMAGNQYGRVTFDDWHSWWEQNGPTFELDDAASETYLSTYSVKDVSVNAKANFYSMPIVSERLVFVLDRSGSMTEGTKFGTLVENMKTTIADLEQGTHFNIISYAHDIDSWSKGLSTDRRGGFAYVDKMQAIGGTNIYDSGFTGVMTGAATAIYMLTDGEPIAGVFQDWTDITASFILFNRYRPLTFNTVAIETEAKTAQAMQQLSLMTNGDHMTF